jgi:hypothetical protein
VGCKGTAPRALNLCLPKQRALANCKGHVPGTHCWQGSGISLMPLQLRPQEMCLLVRKQPTFSTCTQIKNNTQLLSSLHKLPATERKETQTRIKNSHHYAGSRRVRPRFRPSVADVLVWATWSHVNSPRHFFLQSSLPFSFLSSTSEKKAWSMKRE